MRQPRIGRLAGRFVVTWIEPDGTRRRYRLDATTIKGAEAEGRDIFRRETARKSDLTFTTLLDMYRAEKSGRPIATTMGYTGKSLMAAFGTMRPDQITVNDCRQYRKAREKSGIKTGSVWTELGHLRMVCSWAAKRGLIDRAPHIELPQKPQPKDRWLDDTEITRIITADAEPHIRLAIMLMLATAARVGAILDLTWDRVDFDRNQIDLRIDSEGPRKGRAVVPITSTLRGALANAAECALTDYVIEWAGHPVKSIRTGFNKTVKNSGLKSVTPHVLRHTAGVRMAVAGIPMQKISQYMGHSNTAVTERVYARFAPDHLSDAAAALEFGGLRIVKSVH